MTINESYPRYVGHGYSPRDSNNRFPYSADDNLVNAVNMAIDLNRPLLLKGPPGCGKTLLAESVAHELGLEERLYKWHVKSTSRAREGLYSIDVLRRIQDAQSQQLKPLKDYLTFGGLGKAIQARGGRSIVLIDEIDKADIDFPNDLLLELDRLEFTIEELPEEDETDDFRRRYAAPSGAKPIVFITSNDEKELPEAFLRRCLFHWIDFPSDEKLEEIVRLNMTDELEQIKQNLVDVAIKKLKEIRSLDGLRKKPATSELIDWLRILHRWNVPMEKLQADLDELPGLQALLKHQKDLERANRARDEL